MSETYSVYNQNGTLVNETAVCRVVKIRAGVYTWEIAGGSAASTDADAQVSDDNYSIIRAEITSTERAGVPIEWAVNSAGDFYVVAVCGSQIIDGLPDSAFAYDSQQKVLWLECPFENAEEWVAYIYRAEKPANNFAIAEGRARISGIQAQFEKDNRVMRQIIAERVRLLRTPDAIKTLPPKDGRAGKVLAFDADGNPIAEISTADVEEIVGALNDIMVAKSVAEFAAREASTASSVATEKMTETVNAKAQTENLANAMVGLANAVDAAVADFNSTVNTKVAAVGSAETAALANISTAKTNAVGDVNSAKSTALTNIGTAKTNALSDISTAKTNAVSDISTIKGEVQSAGTTATGNIADAKTAALSDISTAKTGAVGDVGTAKTNALGDISTAKTNAVADVGTAKTEAVSDVNTAKAAALSDITDAGASYQRQISENAARLSGAVWPDASKPTAQFVAQHQYGSGGYSWLGGTVARASAKFTVIGRYLPVSGEWKLFLEAMNGYSSGACLRVAADRKTIGWYQYITSGVYSYDETELAEEISFGDILTYVYDAGAVKIYKNKTLIIDTSISDSNYLSGNIDGFCELVKGINYKQNLLISVGNAFPLATNDYYYSISDFVDGVPIPAGLLTAQTNINVSSFTDATGLNLTQTTGTYSQSFSGETGCAKIVPGGLHATTKRVRYLATKSPYFVAKAATGKVRVKFYLPASNVNWKYVGIGFATDFMSASPKAVWEETTNVLDANNCAAAADEWQTLEFVFNNKYTSNNLLSFYFRPNSGTGIASADIGQAISSAANDAFYISELSIEYQPAIDNYVDVPLQNEVFVQKAVLPRNMVVASNPNSLYNEAEVVSLGDGGANTVISTVNDLNLSYGAYLYCDDFDFFPFGTYAPKTLMIKINERSSLAADETISFNLDTPFASETLTKADAVSTNDGSWFIFPAKYVWARSLRDLDYTFQFYAYTSNLTNLTGKIKIIWERIS